ncbi:hypothetical protein [Halovivax limisalsi]|uniref:hypothetical protein n=1 Tax=Halovivax limisalsi TaxID=1453760 RepID=UPI001FFD085C|nr:hypothetical protein [Halovivax limisalsi]
MAQNSLESATDSSRIAASAGIGVLAAAVGYLLATLLIRDEVAQNLDPIAEWKGTAWYYFSAHFVELEASGAVGGFSGSDSVNLIAESGSQNAELLYALPPLVLLVGGAFLASRLGARDLGEAVTTGAPITVGYGVVMGLGALVVESSSQGAVFGIEWGGSAAPALLPAIVLAGILYPLVFGTAGAVAATALSSR